MDCGLDSTLAVLPIQFDKGVRSRSNSYNFGDGAAVAQTKLRLQTANLDPSSAVFTSHRRQASDASEFDSTHVSGSPFFSPKFEHGHSYPQSHGSISPAALEVCPESCDPYGDAPPATNFGDQSLDEAFRASLMMVDQNGFNQTQQDAQMNAVGTMDQAYQDMLRRSSNAAMHSQLSSDYALNSAGIQRQFLPDEDSSMPLYDGVYAQSIDNTLPGHFEGLDPSVQPESCFPGRRRDFSQVQTEPGVQSLFGPGFNVETNYDMLPLQSDQLPIDNDLWSTSQNTQIGADHLAIPLSDPFTKTKLENTSPYSDCVSFDENGSPSVDQLLLSRTNSHSSYVPYDSNGRSAPPSPFVKQEDHLPSNSFHQNAYDISDPTYSHSPQPLNYAFLHPQVSQGSLRAEYYNQPTQMFEDFTVFTAPNIAINPPTPAQSFSSRQNAYPFPDQPVPLITTTSVPSLQAAQQFPYSVRNLSVGERARGRSNSDSRLMVGGQVPVRSLSHSSQDSSSSSVETNSRNGSVVGIDIRTKTHLGVSRSDDRSRRASWSGARGSMDRELLGSARDQKQKNPATFICPVDGCRKAFTRAYNLRSHQRTHTDERPFLCDVCHKGFARQHDRKRHEKLHTNEKPFTCPGCKKQFARMDALSRHFKSETGKDCIIENPDYQHFLDELEA